MKNFSLYLMILLYVGAGINHCMHPGFYLAIMPPQLPYPKSLVYISGICEALIALLLLPVTTRKLAAWLLIMLLVAIFPANIQMAINYWHSGNPHLWIAILRLPIQPVLIWWARLYTR